MSTAPDIQWQFEECFRVIESFEYFLDEYVWIEDKSTNLPIKLKLWPSQREALPQIENRLLIALKAHQLGYTWIFVAARALWLSITRPLHQVVINSFNEDAGKEIVDRINFIRWRLPDWLMPEVGTDNSLYLQFVHRDPDTGAKCPSTIQIIPATEKGGQSKTPNVMYFDESCWNRYVQTAYNGSLPGITQAKGQIIIISNAIKTAPGWPFTRSLYVGSMKGENDFHRIFLPWWANPNRSRNHVPGMTDEKNQPMTEFKLQQLRSGGASGGMMDEEDFEQRYPESEAEAISLLGGSYFGRALKRHSEPMKGARGRLEWDTDKNVVFVPDERGIWEFWKFPYHLHPDFKENHDPHWLDRYCIGTDVSQGLGQDYSVMYVMDRKGWDLIARCRTNRVDEDEWGYELYKAAAYFRDLEQPALVTPARRGATNAIKRLEKLGFRNFYVRQVADVTGHGMTNQIGFLETEESKKELAGDLRTYLRTTRARVYDALLLDECSTYIRHDNGKLGAEEGHHDDCVVAGACAVQGDLWLERPPRTVPIDNTPHWYKKLRGERESTWTR